MRRGVYRNYYKGHMDKIKGRVEVGEGGGFSWDGVEGWGEKCRQLYLNNNKIIKKKKKWLWFVVGYGSLFGFLWLVLSWKWGQKLGKLRVIPKVLAIWGLLSQKLLFGFLDSLETVVRV